MNELKENNLVDFFLDMPEERQLIWLKTMHREEEKIFYTCVEKLLFMELSPAVKARIIGLYSQICLQKSSLERSAFMRQLYFFSQCPDYQLKLAAKSAIVLLENGSGISVNAKKTLALNPANRIPGNSFKKSGLTVLLGLSFLIFTGLSHLSQKSTAIIEFKPSSTFLPYAAKENSHPTAGEYKKKISLSAVAETRIEQKNEPKLKTVPEPETASKIVPDPEQKPMTETDTSKPVVIPEFSKMIVWDISEEKKTENHQPIAEAKQDIKPEPDTKKETVAKTPPQKAVNQNISFPALKPGLERRLIMDELSGIALNKDDDMLQISPRLLDEPAECQLLFVQEKLQKTSCQIKIAQRDPDFPLHGWGEILQQRLAKEGLIIQSLKDLNWSAETSGSKYQLQLSESFFHGTRIFAAELKSEFIHK